MSLNRILKGETCGRWLLGRFMFRRLSKMCFYDDDYEEQESAKNPLQRVPTLPITKVQLSQTEVRAISYNQTSKTETQCIHKHTFNTIPKSKVSKEERV